MVVAACSVQVTTTRYRAVPARLVGAMMMRGAAFRDRTTATKAQQRLDGPSVASHPRSLMSRCRCSDVCTPSSAWGARGSCYERIVPKLAHPCASRGFGLISPKWGTKEPRARAPVLGASKTLFTHRA
jgi:hypothetical protein